MIIEITSGKHKLVIDSVAGGRAIEWFVDDLQILRPIEDHAVSSGWYLMAPWAGRIKNNEVVFNGKHFPQEINFQEWAIHGTVAFEEGKVQNQTSTSVEIIHETNDLWPIKMEIVQKWFITHNFVKCQVLVSSSSGEFPAEIGWHPWFKRQLKKGKPARFGIEAISQYEKDGKLITLNETKPIGIPPFDDTFDVPSGKGFIEWPDALRVDFLSDVDTFVIFDEPKDFFCIEPQTGPPDAINQPRHIVSPGKPLEASVKWEVTRL